MDLVQWWLIGPAGKSASFVPGAVICVCPGVNGKAMIASVLATYKVSATHATPYGECRWSTRTVFISGTPSPLASRNKVMRLPPLSDAPARALTFPEM